MPTETSNTLLACVTLRMHQMPTVRRYINLELSLAARQSYASERCLPQTANRRGLSLLPVTMDTMLALHQQRYGDITTDMLFGPIPKPIPTPTQVLIRVHAAALNPADILRNSLKLEEQFPIVVGYDVAGIIETVGDQVTDFKIGDRVFANLMPTGTGPKLFGSVAEYAVCEQYLLAQIPASISYIDAAAVPAVAQTAVAALMVADCKKGDKVFVSAGAGGVGIHLIQIAKALFGASEVATTASSHKADIVSKYGADRIVDYRKENAGLVLKEWADVVIDCTKETDMEKNILKPGGRLVSISEFSKPDVKSFSLAPTSDIIEKVRSLLADGKLVPVIDTVYPFAESKRAVQDLARGRATGKIVIKVLE